MDKTLKCGKKKTDWNLLKQQKLEKILNLILVKYYVKRHVTESLLANFTTQSMVSDLFGQRS